MLNVGPNHVGLLALDLGLVSARTPLAIGRARSACCGLRATVGHVSDPVSDQPRCGEGGTRPPVCGSRALRGPVRKFPWPAPGCCALVLAAVAKVFVIQDGAYRHSMEYYTQFVLHVCAIARYTS